MNVVTENAPQSAIDLTGQWQGSVEGAEANEGRIALRFWRENGDWSGLLKIEIGGRSGRRLASINVEGSSLRFSSRGFHYVGEISLDGNSIAGHRTAVDTRPLRFERAFGNQLWEFDTSPHSTQFVEVEKGVQLEVLDWGGTGRPLILLAGFESTAHIFDSFAPKLTDVCHVYGVTRRGLGKSSAPKLDGKNYTTDRLGDDVLAVIEALGIERAVLAGHSFGGAEMSSIGSRFPEKVAGLIYLDAGHGIAYYVPSLGCPEIDAREFAAKLKKVTGLGVEPHERNSLVAEILLEDWPRIERWLKEWHALLQAMPEPALKPMESEQLPPRQMPVFEPSLYVIWENCQKYTRIDCPILAIVADPKQIGGVQSDDPGARAVAQVRADWSRKQAEAFESGLPHAQVVHLANARHDIFRSNEEDCLREMKMFIASLPE